MEFNRYDARILII